MKNFRQDK